MVLWPEPGILPPAWFLSPSAPCSPLRQSYLNYTLQFSDIRTQQWTSGGALCTPLHSHPQATKPPCKLLLPIQLPPHSSGLGVDLLLPRTHHPAPNTLHSQLTEASTLFVTRQTVTRLNSFTTSCLLGPQQHGAQLTGVTQRAFLRHAGLMMQRWQWALVALSFL